MPTDKGDIEDQSVPPMAQVQPRRGGGYRGYFKVRGSAEARLRKTLIEADTPLDYNDIHDKLVAGLKSLFHRIKKNEAWTSVAMDKVRLAMDRYDEIIAAMKLEVSAMRRPAAQREAFEEATGMYITQLRTAYQHGKVGEPPRAMLFSTDLPLYRGKDIPLAKPPKGKKDGISWIRRKTTTPWPTCATPMRGRRLITMASVDTITRPPSMVPG